MPHISLLRCGITQSLVLSVVVSHISKSRCGAPALHPNLHPRPSPHLDPTFVTIRGLANHTSQTQFRRPPAHGSDAKRDVGVELNSQFFGSLDNVGALHTAGKRFILHLFAHTRHIDVED